MMKRFHDKLKKCLNIVKDLYGNILNIPEKREIILNLEYMSHPTMGHASYNNKARVTKHIISLNRKYVERHHGIYENEIIPHEVAHIICFINGVEEDHDFIWSELTKCMGGSGEKKIDMEGKNK